MTSLKQQLEQARALIAQPFVTDQDEGTAVSVLDSILADLSRPFDPTECGFVINAAGADLHITTYSHPTSDFAFRLKTNRIWLEIWYSHYCKNLYDGPWPANQFDGVRLLLSLGVIKEGE